MKNQRISAQSADMNLLVDWCSYKAAKHAVLSWHYSKRMPIGKLVKIGVWEYEKYIGCVIFGFGASPQLHKKYNLNRTEVCELLRVALNSHKTEVSKILKISISYLKKHCPKTKLIISFADPEHGHIGKIYQANNWVYVGRSTPGKYYKTKGGVLVHNRDFQGPRGFVHSTDREVLQAAYTKRRRALIKNKDIIPTTTLPKYKYLYPLDKTTRRKTIQHSQIYPKRLPVEANPPRVDGGATPTQPLQLNEYI